MNSLIVGAFFMRMGKTPCLIPQDNIMAKPSIRLIDSFSHYNNSGSGGFFLLSAWMTAFWQMKPDAVWRNVLKYGCPGLMTE